MDKNSVSLENILSEGIVLESFENLVYGASGLLVVGNIYNDKLLTETMNFSKESGLLMVYNANLDDMREKILEKTGLISGIDLRKKYMNSNLSEVDFQVYELIITLNQFGGIENLLSSVTSENRGKIESLLELVKKDDLVLKRIKKNENEMYEKIGVKILEADKYDIAIIQFIANRTAKVLASQDGKIVISDPILATLTKKYAIENGNDPNNYVSINSQNSAMRIIDETADGINEIYIGGEIYDSEVHGGRKLDYCFSNLSFGGINQNSLEAKLGVVVSNNVEKPGVDEKLGIIAFSDAYGAILTLDEISMLDYTGKNEFGLTKEYLLTQLDEIVKTYSDTIIDKKVA